MKFEENESNNEIELQYEMVYKPFNLLEDFGSVGGATKKQKETINQQNIFKQKKYSIYR